MKRRRSRIDLLSPGQVWLRGKSRRMITAVDEHSVEFLQLSATHGMGRVGERRSISRIAMSQWIKDAQRLTR